MADKIHWWPGADRQSIPVVMPDNGDGAHALGVAPQGLGGPEDRLLWLLGADGRMVPVRAFSNGDNPRTYRLAVDGAGAGLALGDVAYTHEQAVPATVWTIVHPLGYQPSVSVVDTLGRRVFGDIEYVNATTITATFSAAFSGKAYLS